MILEYIDDIWSKMKIFLLEVRITDTCQLVVGSQDQIVPNPRVVFIEDLYN